MRKEKFLIIFNLAILLVLFSAMRIFLIFSKNFYSYIENNLLLILFRGLLEDFLVISLLGIILLGWTFFLKKNNSNLFIFRLGLIVFFTVEILLLFICFVNAVYFSLAGSHLHYSYFSFAFYVTSFSSSIWSFFTAYNIILLAFLLIPFVYLSYFIIKKIRFSFLPTFRLRYCLLAFFILVSLILSYFLPKLFFQDHFADDLSKNFLYYLTVNSDKSYCHRADITSLVDKIEVGDLEIEYIRFNKMPDYEFFDEDYPLAKAPKKDLCLLGLFRKEECQEYLDEKGDLLVEILDYNFNKEKIQPNVILIFLESFGAKYLSPEITPFFYRLASENLSFSNFYSNGTDTTRSIISSLCSILPQTGPPEINTAINLELLCLPQILKSFGYHNVEMQSGDLDFLDKRPFFRKIGFDEILGQHELKDGKSDWEWGISDKNLYKKVTEKIESVADGPVFLTLYTLAIHHPFNLPSDGNKMIYPHDTFPNKIKNLLYYTDESLNEFFSQNKDKEWFKNSIILITADHGQPLGERPFNYMNFVNLYEENIWVPLVIIDNQKKIFSGKRDIVSSHLDIAPTILDLLGIKVMNHFQGKSLIDENLDYHQSFMYSTNPYLGCMSALRKGDYKLIKQFYREGDLFFNLSSDRDEKNNLVSKESENFFSIKKLVDKIYFYQYYFYRRNKFWSEHLQNLFTESLELKK